MNFLYNRATPFFNEREIEFREECIRRLSSTVRHTLLTMNRAWDFERIEGPILTPPDCVSQEHINSGDVFQLREDDRVLRAETTASSYLMMQHILKTTKVKLPFCVWQSGISFRTEKSDGATAAKLRFNGFWQLEFQCAYTKDSKADYYNTLVHAIANEIGSLLNRDTNIVLSERLPSYSLVTRDVEVEYKKRNAEMCSCSVRYDYPDENVAVAELAIGLDRLIAVKFE